ncbi:hypothetical protein FMN50_10255 [Rhodobacterales bacterium]|nr:hypothetical protein FMN50_10255 [Rhodobacterales bacterium]
MLKFAPHAVGLLAVVALSISAWRPASAQGQAGDMVPASAVVGVETVPVDGNIDRFRAVLIESDEGGDLYIFSNESGGGWTEKVHAPNLVWRGSMYGQEPWLDATEKGSVKVFSENSAVGRNRWEQVLTIAYRNDEFVVAGFTYTYYDTLDPDANGKCDVNLLTGKGDLNGKAIRSSVKAVKVDEWSMDTTIPECEIQ